MMTVSMLARRCGLSRTALLYYEAQGLLRKAPRTASNYRVYSEDDEARVRHIGMLRGVGLSVAEIRALLCQPGTGATAVLERRLQAIDAEIEALRDHQRAILRLLQRSEQLRSKQMMTKEKWVAVMTAAGFSEGDMDRWHAQFEKNAPTEHQEFLEYLQIPEEEAAEIRAWSRKAGEDRGACVG